MGALARTHARPAGCRQEASREACFILTEQDALEDCRAVRIMRLPRARAPFLFHHSLLSAGAQKQTIITTT